MSSPLERCIGLINSHFSLLPEKLSSSRSFLELEILLTDVINHFIDKDTGRLINACYKIDLEEKVFNDIISKEDPSDIASKLAKEILKREILKIKTRDAYKNN